MVNNKNKSGKNEKKVTSNNQLNTQEDFDMSINDVLDNIQNSTVPDEVESKSSNDFLDNISNDCNEMVKSIEGTESTKSTKTTKPKTNISNFKEALLQGTDIKSNNVESSTRTTHKANLNNNSSYSSNNAKFKNNSSNNMSDSSYNKNYDIKKSNIVKKPGRTLILKTYNEYILDDTILLQLNGVLKINKTKQSIIFIIFDNVQNALSGLKTLKQVSPNLKVKFSYYKVFFTISGLTDTCDYNVVKKGIIDYVTENTAANILYCKLYRKNNSYIGCGDLTVDMLDSAIKLVSKTDYIKDFSFDKYSGVFYKFNEKKTDT